MQVSELNHLLGSMDLFLLDQLLKGRFHSEMKILDAGCGEGRNLNYFFHHGYDIYGLDLNPDAIRILHFLIGSTYPHIDKQHFTIGAIESMPYKNEYFDAITCTSVLHDATSRDHFLAMFRELDRCLKPGGTLLSSTAYLGQGEDQPDSGFSFYLDDATIAHLLNISNFRKTAPAKTVHWETGPTLIQLILEKDG